jgi:hypothetical protein
MYQKSISFIKNNPFKALILILSLLVIKEMIYIQTFQDTVSPVADGYSEANAIRGAVNFHDNGFSPTSGLPFFNHPTILTEFGNSKDRAAYTHYPPGPEYVNWFWMLLFGKGQFNLSRYFHILLSFFIGIYFLHFFFHFVGGGLRGFVLGLLLVLPPMYSNYMHGLHYQQLAFLILQLQIVITMLYFQDNKKIYLLSFLLMGFFQGWLSFDFAFLASLHAIPLFILMKEKYSLKLKSLIFPVLLSGIGFTTAHGIHFYQVVHYLGGMENALKDFTQTASHRANNTVSETYKANPKYLSDQIGLFSVAKDFLYRVAGRGKYLAINLMNFIWIIIALRFIKKMETKKYCFEFELRNSDLLALGSSVLVSSFWSIIMRQHAHIHGFIARHYYFCYLFCCLILVTRTSVFKKDQSLAVAK